MKYIKGNTFAELYANAIQQVYDKPDFESKPRGLKIRECLNCVLELGNPLDNLFRCNDKQFTLATGYLKKEMCLYLSATNDVAKFAKASSFWNRIANPDGKTINSAYGNLIFNPSLADGRSQFDWAFDCLKADKDSRQAFMRFNNTSHQYKGVKDLPCTFIYLFHIRGNKLYATVEMRSNDLCKGLAYDLPSFTLFQQLMYLKLKEQAYPELELGTYTHISNSLHVYETDFELTKGRIEKGLLPNAFPMPNDWRCIKSNDVNSILKKKLDNEEIDCKFELDANIDFYNWILR